MRIEYDIRLIEQAVFLAARRAPALERELHAHADPLYLLVPGAAREAQFHRAYAGLFQLWKLDTVLPPLLAEPAVGGWIEKGVSRCLVREAARRRDESAELLVRSEGRPARESRTLAIQLLPASLLDRERLEAFLRRELLHVADMLDPRFGYDRASLEGGSPQQNLIRDRYRVLWDIYVEGRLLRGGVIGPGSISRLQAQFFRAFSHVGVEPTSQWFERIAGVARISHAELLAWARSLDIRQWPAPDTDSFHQQRAP